MSKRYFVDERTGCIAVRDRLLTDPEYQGLHPDNPGVVFYEHGTPRRKECPTCHHISSDGWDLSDDVRKSAQEMCDALNEEAERKDK